MLSAVECSYLGIDWTPIIIATIGAGAAIFASVRATDAAKSARINTSMLKTNSGLTVGQHIEAFRGELEAMAADKTQADAQLVAAALTAVAKLATSAESPPMSQQATHTADALLDLADQTAADLKGTP
jgi:hypothetical protein